jgi:hypothetical protein
MALRASLAVLLGGCANIGYGKPYTVSERPGPVRRQTVPIEGVVATTEQYGAQLTITASRACRVEDVRTVSATEQTDRKNESAGTDWALAGAGAVSLGSGAVLIGDASSTYPNDTSSRQYNPTGPGKERAYGIGLVAIGATLVGVAGYDGIRASGSETTTKTYDKTERVVTARKACAASPKKGVEIKLVLDETSISLGLTDANGKLVVDLSAVLPETPKFPSAKHAPLVAEGEKVGSVDLPAVLVAREAEVWKRLDVAACRQPTNSRACVPIEAFLKVYPDGAHATEARKLLVDASPKIDVLVSEEWWARTRPDDCANTKATDLDRLEQDCLMVNNYIAQYPTAPHVAEAKKALAVGNATIAKLRAKKERDAAEAKRRAEAEERAAAEKERQKCIGVCRMGCSSYSIRDPASCLSGCIASRCTP